MTLRRFAFAGVHKYLLAKDRCSTLRSVAEGLNHHNVELSIAKARHVVLHHDATTESLHNLGTVKYGCDEHLPYMVFGSDAAQDTASPASHTVATARVQSCTSAVTIGRRVSLEQHRRCTLSVRVRAPGYCAEHIAIPGALAFCLALYLSCIRRSAIYMLGPARGVAWACLLRL